MNKSKTIIFDIDGTAIDSPIQKHPTDRLIAASQKIAQTHNVCAATGRVWSFAAPVLSAMRLTDPCIISGGTQICHPVTGDIVWQVDIPQGSIHAVLAVARNYAAYKVLYNDYDEVAYLHGGYDVSDLQIEEPIYFFEIIFVLCTVAPKIMEELSRIEGISCSLVVAQRAGFNDIHVTARSATKEHAVAELLRILGPPSSQAVGIGDGHNDIHLFKAVDYKVAMGNAVPELKAAADVIIGNVADEGLATYFEQIMIQV